VSDTASSPPPTGAGDDRSFLAALVQSLMEGLVVCDRDQHLILVNPAAARLLGYKTQELRGRPQSTIIPLDQRPVIEAADARRREGQSDSYEIELERQDGSRLPVRISGSPWQQDGLFSGTVAVFTDLSDQRRSAIERLRLEEQLRESQKMEALGQLAGGIAHDFNNILQVILGFGELAQMEMADDLSPRGAVEEIIAAARRAQELVRQVLSFSRRSEQSVKPLLIQPVVKEGLKMLRSTLPTTIAIRQEVAPDCPAVAANPTFVHQILMNLCTNAMHAMNEGGGTLEVVLEPVDADRVVVSRHHSLRRRDYVRLTVRDDGCGIEKTAIERIFEPYYTTRERGDGTGLGLAMVHGIVSQLGGAITVESELERGTTFHVYLPTAAADERQSVAGVTAANHGGTERILLVDDEPMVVELLARHLDRLGYRVTLARDGHEGLAKFHDAPETFDLLISDQTMPGMTGRELLVAARRLRPDLPAILCTGYSETLGPAEAEQMGAVLLPKPVPLETLARTVRTALAAPPARQTSDPVTG